MGRRAARDETWPLEDDFPLEVLGDFRGFSGWWFGTFFPIYWEYSNHPN